VTVELTSSTLMNARCNNFLTFVLVQISERSYCILSFVDQACTGSDWKSKQRDNAMASREPSTMY